MSPATMLRLLMGLTYMTVAPQKVSLETPSKFGQAPHGLLCDLKASPAMGVSSHPVFAWIVPHLRFAQHHGQRTSKEDACAWPNTGQLQHAFQIQVRAGVQTSLGCSPLLDDMTCDVM